MVAKPPYEELEQRIKELEGELEKHREAAQRFHQHEQILSSIKDTIVIITPDMKTIYANQTAMDLFGNRPEIFTEPCYSFFKNRQYACEDCPVLKAIEDEQPHKAIMMSFDRDGREMWRHNTAFPFYDGDGQVIAGIEIVTDYTQQKKVEDILVRRSEFERLISEISSEFLGMTWDRIDGGINRALASVGTFSGADRAYVFLFKGDGALMDNTHEWCAEGIHPEIHNLKDIEVQRELPWFAGLIRKGAIFQQSNVAELPPEARLEQAHFQAQGIRSLTVVPMLLRGHPIGFMGLDAVRQTRFWTEDDQAILRLVGEVLTNAIERKRADEALMESEEKFSKLFFSSPTWMAISRLEDGKYLEINKTFEEITGFDRQATIGRTSLELGLLSEPSKRKELMALAREKGGFREQEITFFTRNGTPVTTLWSAEVIELEGETCLLSTVMDISELKRARVERRKLEERLHRAQKMEAMGLLAGGVAHDLNNILSGIVSYPELILMDLPEKSPLRKPIAIMQESGMRAADVVADLLTIARGVAVGKEPLNLNTIVNEYLDSPEFRELKNKHPFIDFRAEIDTDLLNMKGSSIHIKKMLMNLVANATEAIEQSGTVTISTRNRYLDEPIRDYEEIRKGKYVVLSVSDDGSGIHAEDIGRIFEPFYTKKVMGRSGTGLGLAVVWNTVQDHNGYINLESSGNGTIFDLYFPVIREEIAARTKGVDLESLSGHGERILVVDDEEIQRQISTGILGKLGYQVSSVSSGEEAIAYVKAHPLDMILLDMEMPKGINGRETYQEIIKIRPGQKAIIASGYSKTHEVEASQKLGAGEYIKKPYTLEKIGVAVREELKK